MNRKLVLVLTLTLLIGTLSVAFNVQRAEASGTIYIRADGSIDPPDAPISTVDNVTYTLTGNISGSIVIERDNIVVDGAGHTMRGSGSDFGTGIYLWERGNVTVRNTTIENFYYGIAVSSSSDSVVSGNNVTNNHNGIYLDYPSDNNVLSGNNVTANSGNGIWLSSSSNSTLSGNVMVGNGYNFGVEGSELSNYLHSVDASNLVDGKPVYYFVNQSDMVVDTDVYSEVGYLGFVNCDNVTVQGLNLSTNNREGLLLAFTNDSKITGNNVANSGYGIWLGSSSNNALSGNNVTANSWGGIVLEYSTNDNVLSGNNVANGKYGIELVWSSNNNVLSGNNVTDTVIGIWLSSSSNNTLSGNNVANNDGGIELASSSNNTLSGNNVTANDGYGILLDFSSNNTLFSNSVTNNGRGIELDDLSRYNVLSGNNITNTEIGIWLSSLSNNNVLSGNNLTENSQYGVHLTDSSNNSILSNRFMNNIGQVYTQNSNNIWDDGLPSGGNYWSDYNGTDANNDGIGDTPYTIDANNTDHYPLMVQHVIPEFPSFVILSLFMITTLLAVAVYRKKHVGIR